MKKRDNKKGKRGMALSQIVIILLGTIAFSYILGSEIGFVEAYGTPFKWQNPSSNYGCPAEVLSFPLTYEFTDSSQTRVNQTLGYECGENNDANTKPGTLRGIEATYTLNPSTGRWSSDTCLDFAIKRALTPSTPTPSGCSVQNDIVYVGAAPNIGTPRCSAYSGYVERCDVTEICDGEEPSTPPGTSILCCKGRCVPIESEQQEEQQEETPPPTPIPTCSERGEGATIYEIVSGYICKGTSYAASDVNSNQICCKGTYGPITEEVNDEGGGGNPSLTTLLSSVGNGVIQDCMLAFTDWTEIQNCIENAKKLADASGSGNPYANAADAGSPEECMKYFTYAQCNAAFGGADEHGTTTKVCTKYASQVPCGQPFTYSCNDGTTGGAEGTMGCDGGGDEGDGNWQGKQVGSNILNIIAASVEAVSLYLLIKQIEKAIPGLAELDPTSAAHAWLNLGEAVVSGGSLGVDLAVNAFLFNPAHSLAAVPSIFGATGLGAAAIWSGIGVAIAVTLFLIFYNQKTVKVAVLSCIPWQAPMGGDDCNKCGTNGLPCSEYQCNSLGQGCGLLPSGENGEVLCEYINQGDTVAPIMSFYNQLPPGYSASPPGASVVSQGDAGVTINSSEPDGKIPPSTILTVGVTTDEPSRCGISLTRLPLQSEAGDDTLKDLIPMSAGFFEYNHSFVINSPDAETLLTTAGKMDFYIRCGDGNGNNATAYFVIEMDVSDVPDTSPPIVIRTDLPDNSPIPFGLESIRLPIYINERTDVSECKWSRSNRAYSEMEALADCTGAGTGLIIGGSNTGLYKCFANLTGLVDGEVNTFYFRCQDNLGNVHSGTDPFSLRLRGTQALSIVSVSPNNTLIKDSTDSIKVTFHVQTAAGSEGDGTATCEYKDTTGSNNYVPFDNTGDSYISSHEIRLPTGDYSFPIKCVDPAGNAYYSLTTFEVESDREWPVVVRASHDNTNLNIKTNEEATCVYDVVDCNYESGTPMTTVDGITHVTKWISGRTYYVKCKDSFGNEPTINSCSVNGVLSTSQF